MANWKTVDLAQRKLNAALGDLRAAILDFSVSDEKVLELRAEARRADEEPRKTTDKKGLLGLFGL